MDEERTQRRRFCVWRRVRALFAPVQDAEHADVAREDAPDKLGKGIKLARPSPLLKEAWKAINEMDRSWRAWYMVSR